MATRAGAAAPSGAGIGHILSDRLAELRATMNSIVAHPKEGPALANTDQQGRALQLVMGYGHELDAHATPGSKLRGRISQELERDQKGEIKNLKKMLGKFE